MTKLTNKQRRVHANQLLNSGNSVGALSLLEENIRNNPSDIDSVYLSGICHAASANYSDAEIFFTRAIRIRKDLFQVYSDLGLAQYYQKKYKASIGSYKKSLKINPLHIPALSYLALAYLKTNDIRKALPFANKSVALDDSSPTSRNIQALCYRGLSDTAREIEIFKAIISDHPTFYDAHHNLFETYMNTGDVKNAEHVLLSARKLFVINPGLYASLGKLYESENQLSQALTTYTDGISNCGNHPELLTSLARIHISMRSFDNGLVFINRALSINNTFQPALTELCNLYILKKEYENAYTLINKFIASNKELPLIPGLSIAYANACRLIKNYSESIITLEKTLKTPGIYSEARTIALYALGDTYDKTTEYKKAFDTYVKANNVTRPASDINYYVHILDDIKNNVNQSLIDIIGTSDNKTVKPVFIVGMPRSGTSLVEQIICSHPDAHGAGEITELWSIGNEISGSKNLLNYTTSLANLNKSLITTYADRYLTYIEQLNGNTTRVTDKLPHNFMHIGLIKCLFPNAYIIHCHRHPFDVCLSIYFKKFNNNHIYAQSLEELAIFYKRYQALMAHWDTDVNTNIFHISYENLVSNQEIVTRQLVDYLGLDWNDKCLSYYESDRAVMTPSYAQANKPIYKDSMYRWKHYIDFIDPLISVLGDPEQYINP